MRGFTAPSPSAVAAPQTNQARAFWSRAGIASTVVRFEGGRPVVLRQGGVDVSGFL